MLNLQYKFEFHERIFVVFDKVKNFILLIVRRYELSSFCLSFVRILDDLIFLIKYGVSYTCKFYVNFRLTTG